VRELAHVVRRALIDAGRLDDDAAVEQALREGAGPAASSSWSRPIGGEPLPATPPTLEEVERHHILSVLASAGGNQTVAARLLGIERKTLARKLRAAGGPSPREAKERNDEAHPVAGRARRRHPGRDRARDAGLPFRRGEEQGAARPGR
jgi:Response regulator containing CheY-like receiver, AAA-type ATPase, and DNA-binding domains